MNEARRDNAPATELGDDAADIVAGLLDGADGPDRRGTADGPGRAPLVVTAEQRSELARSAARLGLLDLDYDIVDSPFGPLLLVASDEGLVRVAFELEGHDRVLGHLAETVSPRMLRAGGRTSPVARQLNEYFSGARRRFEVPVDLRLVSGFRREVVSRLADIEYGTTDSYAGVARSAGNPAAVRAVGSACSHNPVPIVVPCHRVVRSDGSIGQYLGGTEVKRALLDLERGTPLAG